MNHSARLESRLGSLRRSAVPAMLTFTAIVTIALGFGVILPAYKKPTTRLHGTSSGYEALLRKLGRPLPVQTTAVAERRIEESFLGEGTMASDPVQVPMVPIARIVAVYAQPGQRVRKGQILAELDARKGRVAADSARLAFDSAQAELRRVRVGSAFQLNREQPGLDAVSVASLEKEAGLLREEAAMKEKLYDQGLLSKDRYLEAARTLQDTERSLASAKLSLNMSIPGKGESERVAANTVQDAAAAWREALEELNDYKLVAPADGIVDRVLVHAGEYNQVPGTPAVVLAAGFWFEAYFDQTALDKVASGATAEVHLAARHDETFVGHVVNINPVVSYAAGGPETTRPTRAIGTSGPEWPATFQVRIELAPEGASRLVPGLTGFARVVTEHRGPAVPAGAMMAISGGEGLLAVVDASGWHLRRARYGAMTDGWLEIVSGAAPGEKVIVSGQDVLRAGDRIAETAWKP
jgi:multidrug resistance efflux pump